MQRASNDGVSGSSFGSKGFGSKGSFAKLLALAPFALALTGCSGVLFGNLAVLLLSVGIFYGTLGLGRVQNKPTNTKLPTGNADASHS